MEVITTHINADFDCLGAMVAARRLYPEAVMVFPGSQERSLREFFLRSSAYAFDFFRPKDIDLDNVTRLILVDVRDAKRIGPFAELCERSGVELHIYDHHPDADGGLQGCLEEIRPVGSTVTVLAQLFIERQIAPTADEATLMMLGLFEDTGGLQFSSTTTADFEAATFLHRHGADLSIVAGFITQELTADQVALLHQLLNQREDLLIHGHPVSIAQASSDRQVGDLAIVAHRLRDMQELDALVIAVRMDDRVFLVGRSSLPEIHVGQVLREFGGGGHSYAASATVRDLTLVQVMQQLPEVLKKHIVPHWQARHLMSGSVKCLTAEQDIANAHQLFSRYQVNAMPVLDGGEIVGIMTRQVVDRACYHELGSHPVTEFMDRHFQSAAPETPLEELQQLILNGNQRSVPVVDREGLVGVLTRTDLLKHLVGSQRDKLEPPAQRVSAGSWVKKKQLAGLLRERLSKDIFSLLQTAGGIGDRLGLPTFLVGGFVRDLLLRKGNLDLDLVVEGDGIRFARALAEEVGGRVRCHEKFSTAVVICANGQKIDIASARLEFYPSPAALPTIEHASIKLDLYRRDFTVNTLAIALNQEDFGLLLDFFGAQRDLKDHALRVLHNLSFVEDPTRVFRAVRFEQRLRFRLGRPTQKLLRAALQGGFVARVSGTRLANELRLLLEEADPLPAIQRLAELDLLACLHPAIDYSPALERNLAGAMQALHWFGLLYTEDELQRWMVIFLTLVANLQPDELEDLSSRLVLRPDDRSQVTEQLPEIRGLAERLGHWARRCYQPKQSELFHLLEGYDLELLLFLLGFVQGEAERRWLTHYIVELRNLRTDLGGDDLIALGLPPGPGFKEVLGGLRDARLDQRVNSRADEIAWVKKRFLPRGGKLPPDAVAD